MPTFTTHTITDAGRALLSSVIDSGGDSSIEFTRFEIGDGAEPADATNLQALVHSLFELGVSRVMPSNQVGVTLAQTSFINEAGLSNFYFREMGLFARLAGTSDTPILFAYSNAGEGADYIGEVTSGSITEQSVVMSIAVGAAPIVNVENPLAPANFADIRAVNNETMTKMSALIDAQHPIGDIRWLACADTPAGWLLCDGRAVSRTEFADLFAVIGELWGAGDGSSTFNLPNLIDRAPWGGSTAGGYKEPGLPNIEGTFTAFGGNTSLVSEAFNIEGVNNDVPFSGSTWKTSHLSFSAARSNSIYGNSDTVQPPAAVLRPFIRAAHMSDPSQQLGVPMTQAEIETLIVGEVPQAVNEVLGEAHQIVETYHNGASWYRVWSDGWCEQGGMTDVIAAQETITISLLKPYANDAYYRGATMTSPGGNVANTAATSRSVTFKNQNTSTACKISWHTCGYIS